MIMHKHVYTSADEAARYCMEAINNGNKILVCGNGGSAAMASHLAAELVVRFQHNRRALPCISLTADQSVITACANDFGYESVFSRQVEALGQPDDVLIALSTSGNSKNVNRAIKTALDMSMTVIEPVRSTFESTAYRQENHLQWIHELACRIEKYFV